MRQRQNMVCRFDCSLALWCRHIFAAFRMQRTALGCAGRDGAFSLLRFYTLPFVGCAWLAV
jgi:hypothetical protein